MTDMEIGPIHQLLVAHRLDNCLERAGLGDRRGIEPDILKAAQALNSLDGMPRVESAGGVGQNQPHIGIGQTVAADRSLVDRVGKRAVAHHVQGDGQPQSVGRGDVVLRQIGFDGGSPGRIFGRVGTGAGRVSTKPWIQRRHCVIALQTGHAQAAHFVKDYLSVHVWGNDQLPARVSRQRRGTTDLCANEIIVGLAITEKGEAKEKAAYDASPGMQPLVELRVLGQAQAGRRGCQPYRERIARIVLVAEEVRVGINNAVGQKGQNLPVEKRLVGFGKFNRKHGRFPAVGDRHSLPVTV